MNLLRKKFGLLILLSYFYQPIIFADIDDQYRNQQGEAICNYSNAQFYALDSDYKYCVSGGFWKQFYPSGNSYTEGVLNRSLKNFGLLGSNTITKYKIEGDDLVKYKCKGTFDAYDFDCIGPIDRDVIASRGSKGVISHMDRNFNQTSDKSIAYYNRGNAKLKIKDYRGAIADYTGAIKLNPNDASAYKNRGNAKLEIKDYGGSIADYTSAIKLNPNDAGAYYNLGIVRSRLKTYEGAIVDYTNAIKLNPNYAEAYFRRGNIKINIKRDYSGAIADYTSAIKLNPNYTEAYYNRGIVKKIVNSKGAYNMYQMRKDYKGACKDFKIAFRLWNKSDERWFSKSCKN